LKRFLVEHYQIELRKLPILIIEFILVLLYLMRI